jgi:TonB family protein
MLRSVLFLAALAGQLVAADFGGRWAGAMETGDTRVPIYLFLNEQAGKIGGSVSTGVNARPLAIDNVDSTDAGLSFRVQTNTSRVLRFRLTLTNGVLAGEATVDGQTSKVAVVLVSGGMGGSVPAQGMPQTGAYRVGGGVSSPVLLRKVEPDYTEEARKAKYEGTVLLYAEIGADGRATNIKVQRSLGLGLDEKAIEAVKQWQFKPGEKDGKPVTVAATIEVNFRL